jgi:hypothetical protein
VEIATKECKEVKAGLQAPSGGQGGANVNVLSSVTTWVWFLAGKLEAGK